MPSQRRCSCSFAFRTLIFSVLVASLFAAGCTTNTPSTPGLSAVVAAQGNFSSGEQGASYTITVSNSGNAATTTAVMVVDPPGGFAPTNIAGTGWTCTLSSVTCTRSDALGPELSFPPITVTGNVTANNGTAVTIPLSLSGGGITGTVTVSPTPSITVAAPLLSITKAHTGNFNLGQQGATYTLTVTNGASAGATQGTVTVTEAPPAGLTLVSMSGTGWTCAALPTCTRSDLLPTGQSYPAITVTVNVSATATSPQVNNASVSGGGSAAANATPNSTTIILPQLSISKSHTGNFNQGQIGATYTLTVANAAGAAPTNGTPVTVTEIPPAGLTVTNMSGGSTWTCTAPTCTTSTVLAAGASYTPITVTANVATNATTPQVNNASVSGGGSALANAPADSTTILVPTLSIAKTHSGNFSQGQTGATYTLTVSNSNAVNTGATNGTPVTVTEIPPAGLTVTNMSGGSTWTCTAPTCTTSTVLAAGASYTPITVTANVATNATTPQINNASVSGGGSALANAPADSTTILVPTLSIAKTHSGNFSQGQTGVTYTLTVSNAAGGGSTNGTPVTVTEIPPAGLTVTNMSGGSTWTCTAPTCTTSTVLAAGASYTPITVTANVATNATTPQVNNASVSGGGSALANAPADSTTILVPTLSIAKTHSGNFSQGQTGVTYTLTVSNAAGGGSTNGTPVTVTEIPPAGLTVTNMSGGSTWTCTAPTCTTSTVLAAGASYTPITVTANVATNATTPQVNNASVSGGGSALANATPDSTTILVPTLSIAKTHSGTFLQGQLGATYTLTVSNAAGGGSTNGTPVTVTEIPPAGLTVTNMSGGATWNCTVLPTCTTSNVLAAGASYTPITVTANVATNATTPQINNASVSGGGSALANAPADSTTILVPTLGITKSHLGTFLQGQVGATYTITVSNSITATAPTNGTPVTVTEIPPAGLTVTNMSGGATWNCTVLPTCTTSNVLAAGASYQPITVTVNVATNATSPQVNNASVSGGGSASANATPDSTTVGFIDLAISKTHVGIFSAGSNGTYNLAVSNLGNTATTGTVTVSDTLPPGLTFVSGIAAGWNNCTAVGPAVTCTNSTPINGGTSATPIPLIVSVSPTASGNFSNTASVATTGDNNAANNSSTDSSVNIAPDLAITKTHTGTFLAGSTANYMIAVNNVGNGATTGLITVTDTLPIGLSFGGGSTVGGAGWTCPAPVGQTITCTNPGPINNGASAGNININNLAIGSSVSGNISNTATVATAGDTNAANNSSTDTTSVGVIDLSLTKTHVGLFNAGNPGIYTIAISNVGTVATTGSIMVNDTLPTGLTFTNGTGTNWNCSAVGQAVTCTYTGAINGGTSAGNITLTVAIATGTSGTVLSNTATVTTANDNNAANNSSTDSVTVTTGPASVGITLQGVTFANGNAEPFGISVFNDQAGDVLTPTLTTSTGGACTPTACGTLGAITGTSGSGTYSLQYTPPTSGNLTVATTFTLTVSSSLSGSFAAAMNFTVNPAGVRFVSVSGVGQIVNPGSGIRSPLSVSVYNDTGNAGATLSLIAGGHACPTTNGPPGSTICGAIALIGTQGNGTTSVGTTGIPFTNQQFSYTPPAPGFIQDPYDRPMFLAVSKADPSKVGSNNFRLSIGGGTKMLIQNNSTLDSALTGSTAITLSAVLTGDTGNSKTVNWTLTANGTNCSPACGTLGTPAYTRNTNTSGMTTVTATIPYTPPATVPTNNQVTLTATSVDDAAQFDSTTFNIVDGTCGTGHESLLNGQYAFLLKGSAPNTGYNALIGSFTTNGLNGSGLVTAGLEDVNRTTGVLTNLTLTGTYSVGADNRGCLTLTNSNGATATYRIALGTLSSGVATQGTMTGFNDNTGSGPRVEGILVKQDPTAFNPGSFSGTYVFEEEGVGNVGERVASAGLVTSNGVNTLTNISFDSDDSLGGTQSLSGGTGTFSIANPAPSGRGTFSSTIGGGTTNSVMYIVSSTQSLIMGTDPPSMTTALLSGQARKQTGPFSQSTLNGNSYVFYGAGIDSGTGGNDTVIGQSTFTTNGNATLTIDENDDGTEKPEEIGPVVFTIASNGRMTLTGAGSNPPVFYLIDSTQAYFVGTDSSVAFGTVEKQTGGPFSTATITGQFFFGGGAPTTEGTFESGTVTFVPASPAGTLTGLEDSASSSNNGGLKSNESISDGGTAPPYAFQTDPSVFTPTAPGQGFVGNGLAYIISPSKIVFMSYSTSTDQSTPENFVVQK